MRDNESKVGLEERGADSNVADGAAGLSQRESVRLLAEAQAMQGLGTLCIGARPGDPVVWSPECAAIFGFTGQSPPSTERLMELVHGADRQSFREAIAAAQRGAVRELALRVVREDGSERFVRVRLGQGEGRVIGVLRDDTGNRHFTERLRATEWRYARLLESTSEGVWVIDAEGRTVFVNARMAEMLEYTREELIGRPALSLMTDEARILGERKLSERSRGLSDTFENAYVRKNGTTLWALVKSNPLYDEHGRYDGALSLMTDISERRQLDEMRNRLAAIVESCQDAIISTDLGGIIETWNRGAEQLYGYSANESIGRSIAVLVPEERAGEERMLLAQVAQGKQVAQFETTRRRKDGLLVDVCIALSPVRDAHGRIVAASKISRNLTEQRRTEAQLRQTEEQLRHAQKLEALGSLAGGVAHDFNNLLSVIQSYVGMAVHELPADSPLKPDLDQVARAAARGAELSRQLLAFGRRQVLEAKVIDLNAVARNVNKMLARVLGENITVMLKLDDALEPVFADAGQLEQVLVNLVVNARDAMPEGGKLIIQTGNVRASDVAANADLAPGEYACITVRDTGCGIDPSILPRVFEPFFTTKPQGKGSGLGLSTVYGIVSQSGGQVRVESKVGVGTAVRVFFPRVRTDASVSPELAPATAQPRGTETILLVEDDDAVRNSLRAVLVRHGYRVLQANSGRDALALFERHASELSLLLTDVALPFLNGRELAARARERCPNLRVLYVSGHSAHLAQTSPSDYMLQKPFTPEALASIVRRALGAPREPAC